MTSPNEYVQYLINKYATVCVCGCGLCVYTHMALADPVGGCGGCNTPLIFPKKCVIIRATVVTDLVVTSSNNACLCTWNSVV